MPYFPGMSLKSFAAGETRVEWRYVILARATLTMVGVNARVHDNTLC